MVPEHAYAVILAGGGGTRLWPKSRKKNPKHLLKLFGKETMLQLTYQRISSILPKERIIIITLEDHVQALLEQLPDFPKENLVVEPLAKNTALAMGVAAMYVAARDPEAVIINSPADHVITNQEKFQKSFIGALRAADKHQDNIIAVGIRPTFAHTGLGYIRIGAQLEQDNGVYIFQSKGFKEKPDLVTAQSFLATGEYLWNANYYCWSVKAITEAFKTHSPEISQGLEQVLAAIGSKNEQQVMKEVYEQAESVQIDIAVSEKADNLIVIPADFDWSDIGDWKVMYDTGQKDQQGNVVSDPDQYLQLDTRDTLIESNGRLIVTIGLKDLIVVDTEDALLICPKDRSQDVKKIVEKLKEEKKDNLL